MDESTSDVSAGRRSEVLATQVAEGLVGDIEHLRRQVSQLERALTARQFVEQAKGILMHRFAIDSATAWNLMTQWSTVTGIDVLVMSEAMVKLAGGDPLLPSVTPDVSRQVLRMMRDQPTDRGPSGRRSIHRKR